LLQQKCRNSITAFYNLQLWLGIIMPRENNTVFVYICWIFTYQYIQIHLGAHPGFYPIGTGAFSECKAPGPWHWLHFTPVPRSRMVGLYVVRSKSFGTFEIARQLDVSNVRWVGLPCGVILNINLFLRHPAVFSHLPRVICSRACSVFWRYSRWLVFMSSILTLFFFFTIGKTFTETEEIAKKEKKIMVISPWAVHIVMNGLSDLRMVYEQRLGRPLTSCEDAHVAQVRGIMRSNRRLTVREIAEEYQHIDRVMPW
jgi:hypothetical protein